VETRKGLTISIDLKNNSMIPLPQFIQNDTNILDILVKENGADADLSNITRIVVNYKRPDKRVISRLLTFTGNKVSYEIGLEEMEVPGQGEMELQFFENDDRISTKRFKVNMLASIGIDAIYENTGQLTVLQELFVEVDTVKTETETARNNADAATEAANTAAANAQLVADENKTKFLPAVATVADRDTVYPTPDHGDTVRVTGEAKIYRYDSVSGWVVTDQYNPAAIDEVNVKLAERPTHNEVQLEVSKVASGAPKGTYIDLTALQTAKPTGDTGNYVLQSNGHIYNWNGSSWVDTGILYQAVGIAEKSVKNNHLDVDLDKWVIPKMINTVPGFYSSTLTTDGRFRRSGVFAVRNGDTVKLNPNYSTYIVKVQSDGTYIEAVSTGWSKISSYTFGFDGYVAFNFTDTASSDILTNIEVNEIERGSYFVSIYNPATKADLDVVKNEMGLTDGGIKYNHLDIDLDEYVMFKPIKTVFGFKASTETSETTRRRSGVIPVSMGDTLKIKSDKTYIVKVDGNGTFIQNVSPAWEIKSSHTFTYDGYAVINFMKTDGTVYTDSDIKTLEKGTYFTSDYNPATKQSLLTMKAEILAETTSDTAFVDKTINCLGDSITQGIIKDGTGYSVVSNPYPSILKNILSAQTVNNYGIGGAPIAGSVSSSFVNRYSTMEINADYVIVFGGTNDYDANKITLGVKGDTTNVSFYGGLYVLINGLISRYPTSKICFILPMQRSDVTGANEFGYTLKQYVAAIKEMCEEYSIPYLDLHYQGGAYPLNTAWRTANFSDGVHPNQSYYYVLANKIAQFIKTL
jgi:lysophospholipase L1-like esterase